jgi:subtilisin family serine protease
MGRFYFNTPSKVVALTVIMTACLGVITAFKSPAPTAGYYRNGALVAFEPDYTQLYVTYNTGVSLAEMEQRGKKASRTEAMLGNTSGKEGYLSAKYYTETAIDGQQLMEQMVQDPNVASVYPAFIRGKQTVLVSNEFFLVLSSQDDEAATSSVKALQDIGAVVVKVYEIGDKTFVKAAIPKNADVWQAAQVMGVLSFVEVAQPSFVSQMAHSLTPNDTRFSEQWFLDQSSDADIDAPEAWQVSLGDPNVIVSVWDTGFQTNHPDMTGRYVFTYDAIEDNSIVTPENANDNHGTACIGLIGATTNNNVGVAGVAPGVKVMPVDIGFGINAQGSFSTITEGFVRAAAWVVSKPGVVAVSCSYGGAGDDAVEQAAYQSIIDNARGGKGAVVLASTGNDGSANEVQFPVYYPNIVGVGASTITDAKASFSNFGDSTDVVAPGAATLTIDRSGTAGYSSTDYTSFNGTSAACPVAAGVVGLIASSDTNLTSYELAEALYRSADKVNASYEITAGYPFGTWSSTSGYGRVNAANGINIVTSNDESRVSEEGITISPNPSDGYLRILIAKPQSRFYTLRVMGLDGRLLQEQVFSPISGSTPVAVQIINKPKGIGFVVIIGAEGKIVARKKVIFN